MTETRRNSLIILFICSLSLALASTEGPEQQCSWEVEGGTTASCGDAWDPKTTSIRDQFNEDGYAVLKDFFGSRNEESSQVSLLGGDWYRFSVKYWDRIFQVLHKQGHVSEPKHVMNKEYVTGKLREPGFKEIVHRYPGRYELALPTNIDNSDENLASLYQGMPPLTKIVEKLEPVILSILQQHPDFANGTHNRTAPEKPYNLLQSMLISAPGSQTQKYHVDTKHTNNEEHLPPHIINVFIPLINITTPDLGPTEVVPKSHFETRLLYNPEKRSQGKQLFEMDDPVAPMLNVGDVLMFDFRILHRGLSNVDLRNLNRPLLVFAFSIPSFEDKANWPGPSIFE